MESIIIKGIKFKPTGVDDVYICDCAVLHAPFDENRCNDWEKSSGKRLLEKWFRENASDDIQRQFDIDLPTVEEVFSQKMIDWWGGDSVKGLVSKQFPIFKDSDERMKSFEGKSCWWWTRSAHTNRVWLVYTVGTINDDNANILCGFVPVLRQKNSESETCEPFHGFKDSKGNWVELQDCGDGNTFVSRDILFFSEFNKDWHKANANAFEGSDIQAALIKWFDENAPEDIKASFDIDLLTMTEIFGETQEDGSKKFWPDEPYAQLPLFKDWRNRAKGEANDNHSRGWWTKSHYFSDFDYIDTVSNVNLFGFAGSYYVNISLGVVPCFRRKKR